MTDAERATQAVNHVMGWSGPDRFSCDKGGYARLKEMLAEQFTTALQAVREEYASLVNALPTILEDLTSERGCSPRCGHVSCDAVRAAIQASRED